MMKKDTEKVLVAYSGGLDTSLLVPWLVKEGHEVIVVIGDLGQREDLTSAAKALLDAGASEAVIVNLRREFAEEFVAEAIRFNGLYEDAYPLSSALARYPLVRAAVSEAKKRGIGLIAHARAGNDNDLLRFKRSVKALAPEIRLWGPLEEGRATRLQLLELAEEVGVRVKEAAERPYSIDENLWGRSVQGGALEDISREPPEEVFRWTFNPDASMEVEVSLEFSGGIPVALNGEPRALHDLVMEMNALAGSAGVGRIDHVESNIAGHKTREVYEAPAAVAILKAHKWLEKAALPGDLLSEKCRVDAKLSELAYQGYWFTPLTKALLAFQGEVAPLVEGEVHLRMKAGRVEVLGIKL